MYKINSKIDKPDIEYMKTRVTQLMQRGIRVGVAEEIYKKYKDIQDDLGMELKVDYGIANANSSKQVVEYMQNMGSPEVYEVAFLDGKWTSNKDVLQQLNYLGYEFAGTLLKYRKAKKFAESCQSLLDYMGQDRLVKPQVSFGKTNRVNYKAPALMNIPKELLWHLIVPSKEGNQLITADIKNQEPSILINMLGAEEFKEALTDERGLYETLFSKPFELKAKLNIWVVPAGTDRNGIWTTAQMAAKQTIPAIYYSPYKPTTDAFFIDGKKVIGINPLNTITDIGKNPEIPTEITVYLEGGKQVTVGVSFKDLDKRILNKVGVTEIDGNITGANIECTGIVRSEFKVAWNAMTYGASAFGIEKMCKHIDGKAIYKYFSKIPEFKDYRQKCTKMADSGIQNINTYFGTPLYADEYNQKVLRRVLMDLPIQGTGSDILSMLIKHFDEEVVNRGLIDRLWIYYTRHDELIIEASKNYIEEVGLEQIKAVIKDILEHQIDDWVPFKLEIDVIEAGKLNIKETLEIIED